MNIIKKICYYLIFFIININILNAQTAIVSESINLRIEDDFELIGQVGNYFYVVKNKLEGATIYAFNDDLTLGWEKNIELDYNYEKLIGSVANLKEFTLFFQLRKSGKTFVYAYKFNDIGELIESEMVVNYGNRSFAPKPEMDYSSDRNKVVLWHDEKDDLLEVVAFDIQKMETSWMDSIYTGKISVRKDLYQTLVNNNGDFYGVFLLDNGRGQKENSRFTILKKNKTEKITINVPLQENVVYDSYFEYDEKNQQLLGGGLYDEKRMNRIRGYFYIRIPNNNPKNQIVAFNFFPDVIINNIKGKEVEEGSTFSDTYVNEIILRTDGGLIIVAERYKKINQIFEPNFPRQPPSGVENNNSQAEYYFDDIILVAINNEGQAEWQDILYKRQYSRDDAGLNSSFFIMKTPQMIRFLYNDEIKNDNMVSEYALLRGGRNERNSILDTGGYNVKLIFKGALQISASELIIPSLKRKSLRLVKMKY